MDATLRYPVLRLLDAYSVYYKIFMDLEDAIKTAFTTGDTIYYYIRMPFGVKNAGPSFQHARTKVFDTQIGQNLEAYVDDIVGKCVAFASHLEHQEETFDHLPTHNMRLSPKKCVFGVSKGKFLEYHI